MRPFLPIRACRFLTGHQYLFLNLFEFRYVALGKRKFAVGREIKIDILTGAPVKFANENMTESVAFSLV
jgi:hypothetical protein